MRGVKGGAVRGVLRALCNEADAAGSAGPKGEDAGLELYGRTEKTGVFVNSPGQTFGSFLTKAGSTSQPRPGFSGSVTIPALTVMPSTTGSTVWSAYPSRSA